MFGKLIGLMKKPSFLKTASHQIYVIHYRNCQRLPEMHQKLVAKISKDVKKLFVFLIKVFNVSIAYTYWQLEEMKVWKIASDRMKEDKVVKPT